MIEIEIKINNVLDYLHKFFEEDFRFCKDKQFIESFDKIVLDEFYDRYESNKQMFLSKLPHVTLYFVLSHFAENGNFDMCIKVIEQLENGNYISIVVEEILSEINDILKQPIKQKLSYSIEQLNILSSSNKINEVNIVLDYLLNTDLHLYIPILQNVLKNPNGDNMKKVMLYNNCFKDIKDVDNSFLLIEKKGSIKSEIIFNPSIDQNFFATNEFETTGTYFSNQTEHSSQIISIATSFYFEYASFYLSRQSIDLNKEQLNCFIVLAYESLRSEKKENIYYDKSFYSAVKNLLF